MTSRALPLLVLTILASSSFAGLRANDEREELARCAAGYLRIKYVETPSSEELDRKRELDTRIGELLQELLGDPTEDEANAFLCELLQEFDPDALPLLERYMGSERYAVEDIEAHLYTLASALELQRTVDGLYPSQSEGLASLAEGDPPFVSRSELADPWGAAFRYRSADGFTYEVRSAGPDGVFDNQDDWSIDGFGEVRRGPSSGEISGDVLFDGRADAAGEAFIGRLEAPGDLWSLELYADGLGTAYVVQRPEGVFVGFGDRERGPYDNYTRLATGDVPGAAAYRAVRDGEHFLVTRDLELAVDGDLFCAWFVSGTRTVAYGVQKNGKPAFWIGDRPLRLEEGELDVGEVGRVVLGEVGSILAYRERRADGYVLHLGSRELGPFEWVAQPRAIHSKGETSVSYRYWNDGKAMLSLGGAEQRYDWARDVVASPGGEQVAFVATELGEPVPYFETQRAKQNAEVLALGFAQTRAFHGGTSFVVTNGQESPRFEHAEEPVFDSDPETTNLAFRARTAEGRWCVVHLRTGGFATYPPFDEVGLPVLSRDGAIVAYEAVLDGQRYVAVNENAGPVSGDVDLLPGPNGTIAFAVGEVGKVAFGIVGDGEAEPVGPFDSVELLGFLPESGLAYARCTTPRGTSSIVTSAGTGVPPAAEWGEVVVTKNELIATFARRPDGAHFPLVFDPVTGTTSDVPGGPFAAVVGPIVTDDGKIAFQTFRSGGPVAEDEYGVPDTFGRPTEIQLFDGEWTTLGPFATVEQLSSRGEAFAWVQGEQDTSRVAWTKGRRPWMGEESDFVPLLLQAPTGEPIYVSKLGERFRVVTPARDFELDYTPESFTLVPDSGRPVFRYGPPGERRWVVGGVHGPTFDHLSGSPLWNDERTLFAIRGNHGGAPYGESYTLGGRNSVVLGDVADPSRHRTLEGDFVSVPEFVDDGSRVRVAVLHGLEIVAAELEL